MELENCFILRSVLVLHNYRTPVRAFITPPPLGGEVKLKSSNWRGGGKISQLGGG